MRIFEFLKSGAFIKQLLLAIIIVGVLGFLLVNFLDFRTRHGEEIEVPNLKKMKIEIAEEKLADLGIEALVLDTVDYNKDFPPFSIVEQDPEAGEKVKDFFKIFRFIRITITTFRYFKGRNSSFVIPSASLNQ